MSDLAEGVELLERQAPSVVFCPHPLMPARERQVIYAPPRADERLDAYLARVIGPLPDPCVVSVGDRRVPRHWWPRLKVKPGVVVGVAAGVAGGGDSDVGRTLLTIAVIVAAVYTGGAAAGALGFVEGSVGYAAVSAAVSATVMTVGMMAVNALMPLPTADLSKLGSSEQASPTYALSGGSNRVRRFEPLPLVIGTHRMFPDAACAWYTLFEGDDQYLYAAFNWGFGDLLVSDLRIGETPLTDYNDVSTAWAAGSMPTLIAGNVDTVAGSALTVAGGPIVKTTSINTTEIHVDLQYVLFYLGDSGGLESASVTVRMEYRVPGGSWLPFVDGGPTLVLSSATRTPVRTTYRRVVASGQYEVRISKETADSTDARLSCDMAVSAIRSLQPDTGDYAGQLILGLKIRASGQLNGAVSQLSGLVSHRLGGVSTSNPAKWFKAFALGAFIGGRRIWGAGLASGKVDVAALDAWATWCDAKGLSCNMVLDQALSVATVLDRIARCGRGSKTWAPGKLSAVWDADNVPVSAMFSPVNIRRGTFKISYPSEPMADELEVSFINPSNNWQRDTVRVPAGATNVKRTATVELLGCNDATLAGKEANLMYAQNQYRFRSISWEADAEGLTVTKGSVVALSHDLTQWGQGGRLVGVSGSTVLTLDRTITLKPAGCWMAVCRPGGAISYHRVQVGATEAEADVVTLLDPLPTTPAVDGSPPVDWRYLADAKATPGWRVKVVEVTPLPGLDGVRIVAQDDPAEYYAAESGTFTHVASPVRSSMPELSGLQIWEELIAAGSGYAVQLHLTWSAKGDVAATQVRYRLNSGPWQDGGFANGTQHMILVPEMGSVSVQVTGFNGMGQSHLGSRLTATHTIEGQAVPPPAVTGFGVSTLADGTRVLDWTVATVPPDVDYCEIRYSASAGTAWSGMTVLGRVPYGSGRAESNVPAAGSWTFEARMLDAAGNYSASGARVTATLGAAPVDGADSTTLRVGLGVNRLYNSSAHPDTPNWDGWWYYTDIAGGFGGGAADRGFVLSAWNTWALPSGSSRYLHAVGSAGAGKVLENNGHLQMVPVTPGQRVEVSVLSGAHRCTAAVGMNWYDASGGLLSQTMVASNVSEQTGGTTLASWKRIGGFAVAPPGAVKVSYIEKLQNATGADPYAFFDQAYLGFANAGQTELSPWSDGPRTVTNTNQLTDGAGFGAAAAAAQAAANTANALLADIAADGKLTAVEKQAAYAEWVAIVGIYGGLDGQAAAMGVTTERTAHTNSYNALSSYLSSLLASLSTTSDISGSTWRTTWADYYSARQALMNKLAAVAATRADWSGVTGTTGAINTVNLAATATTERVVLYDAAGVYHSNMA